MATKAAMHQLAFLTENLDATIAHWIAFTDTGPWTIYKNVTLTGNYRNAPTSVKIDVGLSYQGALQIELIQVTTRGPSPYHDTSGRKLVGMHHVAWLSDDLDADVAAARLRGLAPVFDASNGASRVAYFENPAEPGLLIEYIEVTPEVRAGFHTGREAAAAWDGTTNPVTVIDFAA